MHSHSDFDVNTFERFPMRLSDLATFLVKYKSTVAHSIEQYLTIGDLACHISEVRIVLALLTSFSSTCGSYVPRVPVEKIKSCLTPGCISSTVSQ
jgi:hypothetical protein